MITGIKRLFSLNLVFTVLILVCIPAFSLEFTGCKGDNSAEVVIEDATKNGASSEENTGSTSETGNEVGTNTTADTARETETELTSTTTENDFSSVEKDSNNTGKNIEIYLEKTINIKRVYTIYEDIHMGSIELDMDKESGSIEGYLFLSYKEVKLLHGRSFLCENIVKGIISGSLDPGTGNVLCEAKSNIAGEGNQCFSGDITFIMTGTLSEDGRTIDGGFMLPSGNPLYFILEKK